MKIQSFLILTASLFLFTGCYTDDNRQEEKFFYKEELYKGTWFIVTTAFTFVDGKLVKQETVKEERLFLENDCKK